MTRTIIATTAAIALLAVTAASCDDDPEAKESKARKTAYENLVALQPAEISEYSTTRETINFWIKTWGKGSAKNKLSYVYLDRGNGTYGYYVLKGLPVSYCAMLTPTYEIKDRADGDPDLVVPAPGMDGAYYSGNQCNVYYGIDASTGSYIEFSVGMNQSYHLFSEPQSRSVYEDAVPMGATDINDVNRGDR